MKEIKEGGSVEENKFFISWLHILFVAASLLVEVM